MPGRNAEVSATGASTSTRTCSSSRAGSAWWNGPLVANPALLTSTLTSSSERGDARGEALTGGGLAQVAADRLGAHAELARQLLGERVQRSLRRATRTSLWPRSASSRAIAPPIPADAPVTSAAEVGVGAGQAHRGDRGSVLVGGPAVRSPGNWFAAQAPGTPQTGSPRTGGTT